MEEWNGAAIPEGVRRPWQVLEDDLDEKLSQAEESQRNRRGDEGSNNAGLRAARRLQKAVKVRGAHAAFLDLPLSTRNTYEKVSLMELAAFALWRQARNASRKRGGNSGEEPEQIVSNAWCELSCMQKSTWVPKDSVTAIAGADADGRWSPLLAAYSGVPASGSRPQSAAQPGVRASAGEPNNDDEVVVVAAPRAAPPAGRQAHDQEGDMGTGFHVKGDDGNTTWVKWNKQDRPGSSQDDGRFVFLFRRGDGEQINVSVTSKACGSREDAERVSRLCLSRLDAGATKEEVAQFRNEFAKHLKEGGTVADCTLLTQNEKRKARTSSERSPANNAQMIAAGQQQASAAQLRAEERRGQKRDVSPQARGRPDRRKGARGGRQAAQAPPQPRGARGGAACQQPPPARLPMRTQPVVRPVVPMMPPRPVPPGPGSDMADALAAVCCICGGADADEDNDLGLCDGCDRGFHQRCHTPHVVDFGREDESWFCGDCRAAGVGTTAVSSSGPSAAHGGPSGAQLQPQLMQGARAGGAAPGDTSKKGGGSEPSGSESEGEPAE